jgi:hypothetical protein
VLLKDKNAIIYGAGESAVASPGSSHAKVPGSS